MDVRFYPTLPHQSNSTIPATLHGCDTCRAAGIETRSTSPVIAMCRELLARGYDPVLALHCYRGETLAIAVRAIGEASRLEVSPTGHGFVIKPLREPRARPLVRFGGEGAA
jgi:hypothetical protein